MTEPFTRKSFTKKRQLKKCECGRTTPENQTYCIICVTKILEGKK